MWQEAQRGPRGYSTQVVRNELLKVVLITETVETVENIGGKEEILRRGLHKDEVLATPTTVRTRSYVFQSVSNWRTDVMQRSELDADIGQAVTLSVSSVIKPDTEVSDGGGVGLLEEAEHPLLLKCFDSASTGASSGIGGTCASVALVGVEVIGLDVPGYVHEWDLDGYIYTMSVVTVQLSY